MVAGGKLRVREDPGGALKTLEGQQTLEVLREERMLLFATRVKQFESRTATKSDGA